MNRYILLIGILALTTLSIAKPFKKPSPTSALEFQSLSTDTRIAIEAGFLRFYTNNVERITIDTNGNTAIGTTNTSDYKLRINGKLKVNDALDIDSSRPAGSDDEGLYLRGNNDTYTSIQLATRSHSGSHGILFNAYKSATQGNGNLVLKGNTKFQADDNGYNSGAGLIHFYGNNGGMGFYISETSTGADTDVVWGTPKLHLQRNGNVGINTADPLDAKLHVYRNATTGGWGNMDITKSGFRVQDSNSNLYVDGNALISNGHLQVGTVGSKRLTFGTNDNERMRITESGLVAIGKTSASYKLDVNGTINANTYRADGTVVWPDYVFADSYKLNDLKEVEKFISQNHHLPEVPSEAEVKENGIDLVEMQAKLLQKIEELTLYVIEQNKKIEAQQNKIDKLESEMAKGE